MSERNYRTESPQRPRVVVVTGGTMGLGLAIAKAFREVGDHVVIAARSEATVQSAIAMLESGGGRGAVAGLAADVGDPADAERIVDSTTRKFGSLDVLVNNAGVYGPIGPLSECSEREWADNIRINLLGPANLMRLAIPHMKKAGGGKIINISGGGAVKPTPTFSAYAAAKAGLVRLTETVAHELHAFNIQVNAIAPGFIASRFHDAVVDGSVNADKVIAETTRRNVSRGGDDPRLTANLCLFLAGAESSHITGRLISAVFDDRASLALPAAFASEAFFTLRRVDNVFIFEKDKVTG